MRLSFIAAGLVLAMSGGAVVAQPAPAPAAAAAAKYSTIKTTLETLLADPAAKAILVKHLPALIERAGDLGQAGGMTLKDLQEMTKAYAPDMLSDATLAKIDADLATIK